MMLNPVFRTATWCFRPILPALACVGLLSSAWAYDATDATRRAVQAYNRGDYGLAFKLLKRESDAGITDAQVNLGYMYARGQSTAPDSSEALRLYGLAANKGNGEGWNALGYRAMVANPMDREHAIDHFCKAIALGNPRAMNNLALLIFRDTSFGVERVSEVKSLYAQSAERGNAGAMYSLAMVLMNENAVEAMSWVRRSAEAGFEPAIRYLRQRGFSGPLPRPVDTQGAMKIIEKDAPPGHANVCAALVS
jgi:TPR repeat protein